MVEVVEQLDTSEIEGAYKGGGSPPYPPKMMLALLFYCYAKGIFASRHIEKATYELIPVLYITGGTHPDHDSINTFRQRFLGKLQSLFGQILEYACTLGIFKLGDISIDGTKIQANASKHKAMSWEYAQKLAVQLQGEVEKLLDKSQTEAGENFRDIDIPQELQRRQERLEKIAQVKSEIEARAQVRSEREQADYEAKLRERAAKEKARGRKLGGKKPQAPDAGPKAKSAIAESLSLREIKERIKESQPQPQKEEVFTRLDDVSKQIKKSKKLILGSSRKKKKLESLLAQLEKLH